MDQVPLVYKVDNPVQSSLLSSLILPNTRLPLNPTLRVLSYNKVAKLLVFSEEAGKVEGFIIAYKLYLRIKIREVTTEEQI